MFLNQTYGASLYFVKASGGTAVPKGENRQQAVFVLSQNMRRVKSYQKAPKRARYGEAPPPFEGGAVLYVIF